METPLIWTSEESTVPVLFVIVHGGARARSRGMPPAVEFVWYRLPLTVCVGYAGPRTSRIVTRSAEHETWGFQDVRPDSVTRAGPEVGERPLWIAEAKGPAMSPAMARPSTSRRTSRLRREVARLRCHVPSGKPVAIDRD